MNNKPLIHPGEYVRDELEARDWTQFDLAEITGRPVKVINQVIGGNNSVTPRTATELASAFGTSPDVWMNLQTQFDLANESLVSSSIEKKAKLFEQFPVREVCKRGWIDDWDDADELTEKLCEFWEKTSLEKIELAFAARKTNQDENFTMSQMMWIQQAVRLSRNCDVVLFSKKKLEKHIDELHSLTVHPNEIRRVPEVLAKMGIRFVIVKHLVKTKIDGAAIWIDSKTPLIALSIRYDRIDNFWHTLMHELAHVYFKDKTVIDIELENSPDIESENRANETASNWLIEPGLIGSFARRVGPRFSRSNIIQFSNLHSIHPGIVVGQLHHHKKLDYKKLRAFLVSIRSTVVNHSVSDGWENIKHELPPNSCTTG